LNCPGFFFGTQSFSSKPESVPAPKVTRIGLAGAAVKSSRETLIDQVPARGWIECREERVRSVGQRSRRAGEPS
jgi:hypothetical protein